MDTQPPLLSDQTIATKLATLDMAWAAVGNDYLVRAYKTKNFMAGVALINEIAKLAEAQNHHPDISLSYATVEVRISTHSVAGITESDFALATKIDQLPQ